MRFAIGPIILLTACGSEPNRVEPTPSIVVNQSSLRTAMGESDVDVVGVTIDPLNKERFVLDASRGIFKLVDDGAQKTVGFEEVVTSGSLPQSAFTDIAALGFNQFALVALNDGFKLSLGEINVLSRYFCYVPGIIEEDPEYEVPVQLTNSLTYDYDSELMFAQPQTFDGSVQNDPRLSQIGQFSLAGGEGFGWLDIDDEDFIAGGIVKTGLTEMTLGSKSTLYTYDMRTSSLEKLIDLKELGIERIEDLARDPVSGNLLIVDGGSDDLFEIDLP